MTIHVASKRTFRPDGTTAIYCGRPSPLGNPYRGGPEFPGMAAIEAYAAWLEAELLNGDSPAAKMFASLLRQAERKDITLLCWCAPAPCHCDVIKARLEAAMEDADADYP